MPPGAGRGGAPSGRRGNFFLSKKNQCSISSVNCYEVRGHSHNARGRWGGRWVGSMFCYKRYKGVRGSRGPGVG